MKYINFFKMGALVALLISMLTACKGQNEPKEINGLDAEKTALLTQYVKGVVVPTYKSLADNAIKLADICNQLKDKPSQALVEEACKSWIKARIYWEQSEAILFGAAGDYNIDPHIDSWPLQKTQLDNILKNQELLDELKENGAGADGFSSLGYGLLGFHAVEYIIFRDGKARNVSEISENELIYNAAVSQDLANQTIRLEASWAGIDAVSASKKKTLEEFEIEPTLNYGEIMFTAGMPGNTSYKTQVDAMVQIFQGAGDITDEVGNTKITDPVTSGNVLDVESWYSWNSISDFADNIRSVRNVYYGSVDGTVHANSLATFMEKNHKELDAKIRKAIDKAIKEIEAMPKPFRNHLKKSETQSAVDACNALMEQIDAAINAIQK